MQTAYSLRIAIALFALFIFGCRGNDPAAAGFRATDFEVVVTKLEKRNDTYLIDFEIVNKTSRRYEIKGPTYFDILFSAKADDGVLYTKTLSVPELEPNSRETDYTFVGTSGKTATITTAVRLRQ